MLPPLEIVAGRDQDRRDRRLSDAGDDAEPPQPGALRARKVRPNRIKAAFPATKLDAGADQMVRGVLVLSPQADELPLPAGAGRDATAARPRLFLARRAGRRDGGAARRRPRAAPNQSRRRH